MLGVFAKSFMTAAGYHSVEVRGALPVERSPLPKRKWLSWRGRL